MGKIGTPTLDLKTYDIPENQRDKKGNAKAIMCEAGEERRSASATLDRSKEVRSLNEHKGRFASGEEAWEWMANYLQEYSDAQRAVKKAGLRWNATVGHALIVKPDMSIMEKLTREQQGQLLDDCKDIIVNELGVIKEDNILMWERHWDEGVPHDHIITLAKNDEGRIAGHDMMGPAQHAKLNFELAPKLRERGWEVDECDQHYDPDHVKAIEADQTKTAEEKAQEIRAYKDAAIADKAARKAGRTTNQYLADINADAAEESAAAAKEATAEKEKQEAETLELQHKAKKAKAEKEDAEYDTGQMYQQAAAEQELAQREAAQTRRNAEKHAEKITDEATEQADSIRRDAYADSSSIRESAEHDAEAIRNQASHDVEWEKQQLREQRRKLQEETKKAEEARKAYEEAAKSWGERLLAFAQKTIQNEGAQKLLRKVVERFRVHDMQQLDQQTERERRIALAEAKAADVASHGAAGYDRSL